LAESFDKSQAAARWRLHAGLLGLAYLALGVGYYGTFADMVGVWSHSSTFNHCFLIPFIAVYLGYTKRPQLEYCAPSVSLHGVAYVAPQRSFVDRGRGDVDGLFHASRGGRHGHRQCLGAARADGFSCTLLLPFFYLYFAVPEGEFLVPYLQDWTALVMVSLLKLIGMPVFVEGRDVSIPSGNFTVAEACSGINYLIATLSVATMFAYLQFRSLKRRAVFMVAAVVVPLVANGIRAFGIVIIADLSDYRLAQGIDHFIYGWVFFGVVIAILFWVGRSFSDMDDSDATAPVAPTPMEALSPGRAQRTLAMVVLLCVAPRVALQAQDAARAVAPPIEFKAVAQWSGPAPVTESLASHFPGAAQDLAGRYTAADGRVVSVEVTYFREHDAKGELISQNNRVFDKHEWRQLSHGVRDLPQPLPMKSVNELRLRYKAEKDYLVWYWYEAQGLLAVDSLPVKLAEGWARLRGSNRGAAMIAVRTEIVPGSQAADEALLAFVRSGALLLDNLRVQP
jgi:EpsI family protein